MQNASCQMLLTPENYSRGPPTMHHPDKDLPHQVVFLGGVVCELSEPKKNAEYAPPPSFAHAMLIIDFVGVSGHVRPRQGTEICNFGAPSPLEALHWIFCFFSRFSV